MSYGTPGQNNPYSTPQQPQSPHARPFQNAQREKKVGWPGIVSIAIGVLSGLALFIGVTVATFLVVDAGPGGMDEESPVMMATGLGIIACIGLCFIGLTIGLVGLILPNSNRITAGIGMAINAFAILGICGLMGIGMAAG